MCTLLCTIALTLECTNVTMNACCNSNRDKNNTTAYKSIMQHLPKVLSTSNDKSLVCHVTCVLNAGIAADSSQHQV